jgi:quinohemoprotein ethanol dehydrogenase
MTVFLKRRGVPGVLAATAIASLAIGAQPAAKSPPATRPADSDWPAYGRDGSQMNYSPLAQIDLASVGRLGLAWQYELPSGNSTTEPVQAEGKLFVVTGHSDVRAFNPVTGKLLWTFDGKAREKAGRLLRVGWGPKGLAYWNHRIFIGTQDGRLVAIDAGTGKQIWEAQEVAPGEIRNITGAPRVFGGKVIIGHGGGDITPLRGYITAYDGMTGKRLWRFYTTPKPDEPQDDPAHEMAAKTWLGNRYGGGGGGSSWNAFSYDPELNLIYLGVGNGYPYNQLLRSSGGGDNLFLASIVAVKADTGEYVWHYQICPGEQWDCDDEQDMTLTTIPVNGKPRKVLLQAPKNGFFYVIDRATGQFISAQPFANKITWAYRIDQKTGRPVENPGIRYHGKGMFEMWPGERGAHSWLPQSYSPRTGLVYIPVIEGASIIGDEGLDLSDPKKAGSGYRGEGNPKLPGAYTGHLTAWDPITQKPRWVVNQPGDWPGGVMATAGDLVFEGRIDGKFIAYDARTGKPVWSFQADAPVVAPPISYTLGGRQYISVITGNGASGGGIFSEGNAPYRTDYHMPRRVLTFALDAKARLPKVAPPQPLIAPNDPTYKPDPELAAKGDGLYARNGCLICHGPNLIGGGTAPDLRISPYPLSKEGFDAILHDGALVSAGMPSFQEMSEEDREAIRQYVRSRGQALPKTAGGKRDDKEMTTGDVDD